MTEMATLDEALHATSVVWSLIQGEVLALSDACVVLADAQFPLDERSRRHRRKPATTRG